MTKTSYSGTGSDRFLKAKNYISAFIHLRHFHIHIRAEQCPIAMAEKLIFQSIVNKCSDYHFQRKYILQFGHLTYFGYSLPIFSNAIFYQLSKSQSANFSDNFGNVEKSNLESIFIDLFPSD